MSEHPTAKPATWRVQVYRSHMGAGRPFSGKQLRRIKHKRNHAFARTARKTNE